MKKLMFAASAALCATVGLAIESSNIVGYTGKSSGEQNNFLTIPFASVGFNTSDIQQIKISDGGLGTIGYGTEVFSIWEGEPTVVIGSGFAYYAPMMDPTGMATDYYWGDELGNKAAYSIAPGQAVVIQCSADLTVTTAGQVPNAPVSFTTIEQNNFTGNPFPSAIDIQAIKISDGGLGTIGYGTEVFSVWEGEPTVVIGSGFAYYAPMMDPTGKATDYYWGDELGNKANYSIPAGQGVVIQCSAGLTVTIEPPYSL